MNKYKEFYEIATEIRKKEPWDRMEELDVFGVRIPGSDRVYFLSVMGKLGEWTAISAYRGLEGLTGFYRIQDQGEVLPPTSILTVPHLMLSFREREGLTEEHLKSIIASGLSFRGAGNWPALDIIEPGFLPELPKGAALEDALIVFEQALDIFKRSQDGIDFLYEEHESYDSMLVREQQKAGGKVKWIDTYVPMTEMEFAKEYKKEVSKASVEAVFKLPESRTIVLLDLAILPAPVNDKGEKAYFPFGLLLADKKTGLMLGVKTLPPLPDIHQMYENVPQLVLDQIIELGFRPARFEIRSDILFHLTQSILLRAGCRVLGVKRMDVMDEIIMGLTDEDEWDKDEEVDEEFEEIYGLFMDADTAGKLEIIDTVMESRPELGEDILDMIGDVGSELVYLRKPEQLEYLIARFTKRYSDIYEEYYEGTEKALLAYYLFVGNLKKVEKHLLYIRLNPVTGVDGITPYAFNLLIFRGHTWLALILAGDIWERLQNSTEIFGQPHIPFCLALYLQGLEDLWLLAVKGGTPDWKVFRRRIESHGIEWEEARIKVIAGALENPLQQETIHELLKEGNQKDMLLLLNIHFLIFMKQKHAVSFVLSDLWWNMLMGGGLFGKERDPEAYFYIPFEDLEEHFSEHLDRLLRSNEYEMFGRVFGLKYAYYFLKEVGLITSPWYEKMTHNIQALEFLFERFSSYHLWEMSFVFDWPEVVPFDPERKRIYESTFALYEDEFEGDLDNYFDICMAEFPREITRKLLTVLEREISDLGLFNPDGDELPI